MLNRLFSTKLGSRTVTVACLTVLISASFAQDGTGPLRTGRALDEYLIGTTSLTATNTPLHDELRQLQTDWRVCILRDRRIDPNQRIALQSEAVPRLQVLNQLASAIPDAVVVRTGSTVFIGPSSSMHRLPVLMERNRMAVNAVRKSISNTAARQLTATRSVNWRKLSEPRQILLDHAKLAGVAIANPELIEWDVWDSAELPSMPFSDLATLILNQFDLTIEVTKGAAEITLVPIDSTASFEHRHTFERTLRGSVEPAVMKELPNLSFDWTNTNVTVTASLDEHSKLTEILADVQLSAVVEAAANAPAGSLRTAMFGLGKTQATVGDLIAALRAQKVTIEVVDEESAAVQTVLKSVIRLDAMKVRQPGSQFFPQVFGKYFESVEVLDDRVRLTIK